MKTNEASPASGNWTNAPDKVYLSYCMRSDFIKAVTNGHAGDIEYIRKDILLEWAERQDTLCSKLPQTDTIVGERMAYQKIICKLKLM